VSVVGRSPEVVVLEGVWGSSLDALAEKVAISRDPVAPQDHEGLVAALDGARVLVVRNLTRVDRKLLLEVPSLLMVCRAGVGLDNIDLVAADELGVVVSAARGANAPSVAELALGLALAVFRDIAGHDRRVKQGHWERSLGTELKGRTWGVVGLGATGLATARLAKAVGMSTIGFDPYLSPEADTSPAKRVETLAELLEEAQVVSLHVPLSEQSAGMANRSFFEAMRPASVLINVGRGELVDEQALVEALRSGRLAGAGLDVRSPEPPAPGPLDTLPKVVLTPHVGGLTVEAQERVADMLAADIEALLKGQPVRNAVGRHLAPNRRT